MHDMLAMPRQEYIDIVDDARDLLKEADEILAMIQATGKCPPSDVCTDLLVCTAMSLAAYDPGNAP